MIQITLRILGHGFKMKKQTLLPLLLLGLTTGSGCANSVSETLSSALASAPDWYEDRKTEVKGEGYPQFTEVPATPTVSAGKGVTEQQVAELFLEAEVMRRDPRAISPSEEDRPDPRSWANSVRAELDAAERDILRQSEDENLAAAMN